MTIDNDLTQIFREEATELIEELMDIVAQLARSRGEEFGEKLGDLLRCTHNLKGAATTVGFEQVEMVAHAFEGYMGQFRHVEGPLSPDMVSLAIETFGAMQDHVDAKADASKTESLLSRLALEDRGGQPVLPSSFEHPPVSEKVAKSSDEPHKSPPKEHDSAVRVNTSRLDRLMGFVGDFLRFQTRLTERYERQLDVYKQLQQINKKYPELSGSLSSLLSGMRRLTREGQKDLLDFSNLTEAMSETAKQLRTVPLRGAVHVWRRIVRESNQICHKETELEVDVGRIEIDRYVLERINDPLMHIFRNAVDHGIESIDERRALGKPEKGRILVTASVQGAMIRLEVSDDGRGIDLEKVRGQAISRGLATPDALLRLRDSQVADFLFRTGFSTAKTAGRISGRGVGMDVVRTQLEELGGSVVIRPQGSLGGTSIIMSVPVSILSSEGLVVRVAQSTYALPVESVVRTLRVSAKTLRDVDGKRVIKMEGEDPLRVMMLADLMSKKVVLGDTLHVVVLARGKSEVGLIVDEVLGLKEYVIQALPWNYKHIPGINGAILEADGSVTILIDVLHVFESAHQIGVDTSTFAEKKQQKVLLVDDSLSSRTLQRSMLAADGYDVTLASDGQEAWQILQQGAFNLVVSDVQMPKMDGFELTARIRNAPHTKDLPVILVTSLDTSADREKGANAGADDYLIKGSFDQNALLGIVSRYLGTP